MLCIASGEGRSVERHAIQCHTAGERPLADDGRPYSALQRGRMLVGQGRPSVGKACLPVPCTRERRSVERACDTVP
jgi:hypothetical protein